MKNPFRKPKEILSEVIDSAFTSFLNTRAEQRDITNRNSGMFFHQRRLGYQELEAIYMNTPLGKKIINIPNEYAWKNDFVLTIENETALQDKVLELMKELKIVSLIKDVAKSADIYGSGLLLIHHPYNKAGKPINYDNLINYPELTKFIKVTRPYFTAQPKSSGGFLTSDYLHYDKFNISGSEGIDSSHFGIFKGVDVVDRLKPEYSYIGMSVFQNIYSCMVNDDIITKAITNLTNKASTRYYKLKDLNKLVANKKQDVVLNRLSLLERQGDIFTGVAMDSEDELQVLTQSFASLPELDERSLTRLSASTDIPATMLLGKAPDGMNSTGESDLNNLYSFIHTHQSKLQEPVEEVIKALIAMCGKNPDELKFSFKFNKPQEMSQKEHAELDSLVLQNATTMKDIGVGDEVCKRYLVDNNIVTQEEASDIDLVEKEMDEFSNDDDEDDNKDDKKESKEDKDVKK